MKKMYSLLFVVGLILIALAGCSAGEGSITKEEFDQIKTGMTYEQVVKIVGSEGVQAAESGDPKSKEYTTIYDFSGSGEIGANASFTFQGGKLITKAQTGLQ
jgi:hypothetical protein